MSDTITKEYELNESIFILLHILEALEAKYIFPKDIEIIISKLKTKSIEMLYLHEKKFRNFELIYDEIIHKVKYQEYQNIN